MRKMRKKQAEDFIKLLEQAHIEIKRNAEEGRREQALGLLEQCQEGAIELGNMIEHEEGEGFVTVPLLESYCETVYEAHEELRQTQAVNVNRIYKNLRKSLIKVENSVKQDIKERLEILFLPYKASMWDSLESVWMAADADPDCDAYVMPIPYYDRNPDGSFGIRHYEGDDFPDYVPITRCEEYELSERRPDVIYIHNPYDDSNYVTSVDPRFYSKELKKYTECLVYILYYSTTGGMNKGQSLLWSYFNVDYIVVQCEKIIEYFDPAVPREKFLPFGSPKFDRVIRLCENPPKMPETWEEKMKGRKVYFYNTSINGMLADTEMFLKKIRYVFDTFKGRTDACLLWRPHPLLESTFKSMRNHYYLEYKELKKCFIDNRLGIYDDTPDITRTIAFCDAYLGDAGTSVTSLFGIVGKPMFILNNRLHSQPDEDSWRGEINIGQNYAQQGRFLITQGNRLYVSEPLKHNYKYFCDLSDNVYGGEYNTVWEIGTKWYICPQNAQDILMIDEKGGRSRIELKQVLPKAGSFHWTWKYGRWLILGPVKYPAVVRYDTETGEVRYFTGHRDVFIKESNGMVKIGGTVFYDGKLYHFSPTDRQVHVLDVETGESRITELPTKNKCGYASAIVYKGVFWLMPYGGERLSVTCWNPETNKLKEYSQFPEGFRCTDPIGRIQGEELPFINGAFYGDNLYLTPNYGNMYVVLNVATGEMNEWMLPFGGSEGKEYFYTTLRSAFLYGIPDERNMVQFFFAPTRKLYELNPETNEYSELEVRFDIEELKRHEPGFCKYSERLRYCCRENSFNSLKDFLEGTVTGTPFDRERQINEYKEIASDYAGKSGLKIHEFIRDL